jgi:replicative DNA helicase
MSAPVYSSSAEAHVLGAVLLDARAFDVASVEALQPADFHVARHRAVWEGMRELLHDGRPVDVTTLEPVLRVHETLDLVGGLQGLSRLADVFASVHHVAEHARMVAGYARLRALQAVLDGAAEQIRHAQPKDARELVADVGSRVAELQSGTADGMHSWATVAAAAYEDARARVEQTRRVVSWGFASVDQHFDGGLEPGTLNVIGARPGMGKTAFVQCTSLRSGERGEVPLVFSLEMLAQQLGRRAVASMGQMSNKAAKRPTTSQHWGAYEDARAHLATLPGKIWTAPISLARLVSVARAWRRQTRRPGPLVVDYLQLVEHTGHDRRLPREQQVALTTRTLKKLAKELECPVLLLCQLNRRLEDRPLEERRPRESDFRESGAIEQDADTLCGLFRRGRYDAGAPQSEAELVVIKNREGITGTVPLVFQGHFSRFLDASEFVAAEGAGAGFS